MRNEFGAEKSSSIFHDITCEIWLAYLSPSVLYSPILSDPHRLLSHSIELAEMNICHRQIVTGLEDFSRSHLLLVSSGM